MRKPKRWIIGLLVAFLAACVGVWKWSEGVPYAFLEGKPRIYAEVDDAGTYSEYYAFSETATSVDELISKEIAPNKSGFFGEYTPAAMCHYWDYGPASLYSYDSRPDYALWDRAMGPSVPKRRATVPKGTRVIVGISREPSPVDRLCAWMYRLRFDGLP